MLKDAVDRVYYLQLAMARMRLNEAKSENNMLKSASAGDNTGSIPPPAYSLAPMPDDWFTYSGVDMKPPKETDYERGFKDGFIEAVDYFINKEGVKE